MQYMTDFRFQLLDPVILNKITFSVPVLHRYCWSQLCLKIVLLLDLVTLPSLRSLACLLYRLVRGSGRSSMTAFGT